jgi:uncharacterized protein YndB with AHSA1/START domain
MEHIKHQLLIKAPPEVVYKAVTTQNGLKGWWTSDVNAVPEEGSIAKFGFNEEYHNEMEITALEPNKLVTWNCVDGDNEWLQTNICFDLENVNGNTRLRFAHSNWREATEFFASCNYNWGWYMTSLKEYCETGKGRPFQVRIN